MSWVKKVECWTCRSAFHDYRVISGVWVCECGSPMTLAEIAAYHKTLCSCPAKDRAVVGNACQTCRKPLT